jgi:arabinan endo-1,5-alpha-L-arabinosidase
MKYLSKLFFFLCLGVMAIACGDDAPDDGGGSSGSLSVTVPKVSSITSSSAVVTATASGTGIIGRGLCYSTSTNPTVNDNKVTASSSNMTVTLSGLKANTTYHVRAYVQSSAEVVYSSDVPFTTLGEDDEEEEVQTEGPEALKRVSVHDPSVVWDPSSSNYYIFGSHRAAARSTNMMSWVAFTAPWATATSTNAANKDAFTTPQVTKFKKGGVEYTLNFNAFDW